MSRALLALGLCILAATVHAQQPTEPTNRFTGRYRLAGDPDEHAARERAIDAVCAEMDPVTRLFARPRIVEALVPVERIRLETSGNRHTFILGTWGPVHVTLDGPAQRVHDGNEVVEVSVRWDRGRLWYWRRTGRGLRTDALHVSSDSSTLTIDSVVESSHFPIPLRFRSTYRRED